ncbi:MAG: T9SS type A sorting domain-containing protein [Bacteroidia bacterium]|nr:T9SS type A sorting domain-containing protein [Bacteroidia bacterium]
MRTGILFFFLFILCVTAQTAVGQKDTCQPRIYYDPSAPTSMYLSSLPTPWFGVRMYTEWVSTVDSAFFGFGIHRATASTKRDTLEVRVLGNTLPAFTLLDRMDFVLIPNFNGLFPDGYYVAEFQFDAPVAWINPPGEFWLSWRIKGTPTDQARIMVKKPAIEPRRSVIINSNGSTVLATDYMRTQLGLGAGDSVDFVAEARLCYPFGTPVELVSFHAVWQNDGALLSWETATEVNNYGFEILRQTPSDQQMVKLWERIAFVPGHGTSTRSQQYAFHDIAAEAAADAHGIVRYRLRQLDYDGSAELSHVVEAHAPTPVTGLYLYQNYPHPVRAGSASTVLSFSIPEAQHTRLEVYDALGRMIAAPIDKALSAGRHSIETAIPEIRPGIYFLRLQSGTGVVTRKMIVTE